MFKKLLSGILAVSVIFVSVVALEATPTVSTVFVNGENIAFDAYLINGNNYFKLRDLAYVLNGTEKQFNIGFDNDANAISLISGSPYSSVGGEMSGSVPGVKNSEPSESKVIKDGAGVDLSAYLIENNNYFKLRDIGRTLDFGVDWDSSKNTIVIDTSKGYDPENAEPRPVAETFSRKYYSENEVIPDFGATFGIPENNKRTIGKYLFYEYDIDVVDSVLPKSGTAYSDLLKSEGFIYKEMSEPIKYADGSAVIYSFYFNDDNVMVAFGWSERYMLVLIEPQNKTTDVPVYSNATDVPDFGALFNIPLNKFGNTGTGDVYSYRRCDIRSGLLTEYLDILTAMGFEYQKTKDEDLYFKKDNRTICVALGEDLLYVFTW